MIASQAGVDETAVSVQITPGSVRIVIEVVVASPHAQSTAAALTAGIFASSHALQAALSPALSSAGLSGVSVLSIGTPALVVQQSPPPSLPISASSDTSALTGSAHSGLSTTQVILFAVLGGILLISLIALAIRQAIICRRRRQSGEDATTTYPRAPGSPRMCASPKASPVASPKGVGTPTSPKDAFTNLDAIDFASALTEGRVDADDLESATAASDPSEDTIEGLIRGSNPPVVLNALSGDPAARS